MLEIEAGHAGTSCKFNSGARRCRVEYASMMSRLIVFLLLALAIQGVAAYDSPAVKGFVDKMVSKHHFRRDELVRLFKLAKYKQAVIDAISTPATTKPWLDYRAGFVNDARISAGLRFWRRNAAALRRAEKRYGVPQDIIVALLGVETFYGKQSGSFRAVDALSTLSFDYPPRADFFRGELEQYLLLAREQQFNLLAVKGSYAGALGWPQFMPSSYRKYAVDFNNNGKVDLLHEPDDAIGSVANYLKQFGWVGGEPIAVRVLSGGKPCPEHISGAYTLAGLAASGIVPEHATRSTAPVHLVTFSLKQGEECWLAFGNFDVIKTYNNSNYYAMAVLQLADALRTARAQARR